MFDKLIVSESSDVKDRRSYFMASSLFVAVLFLAAVVLSIYASDYGLGNDSFEISMVVAPTESVDANPPKPQLPATQPQLQNQLPSRRDNIASVNEPAIVPATTSTAASDQLARPNLPFILGPSDSETTIPPGNGRDVSGTNDNRVGLSVPTTASEPDPVIEPPPVRTTPKIKTMVTGGVVNGKASSLPKPFYSAAARAVSAQGKVDVQVIIDESGKVISAKAVSGHFLLRVAAEKAAWNATFTPTLLTGSPVKVTGVIVYNFSI